MDKHRRERRRIRAQKRRLFMMNLVLLTMVIIAFLVMMTTVKNDSVGEEINMSVEAPDMHDIQRDSEYLVLVNKTHGLDQGYEPQDLIHVASRAEDRATKYQKIRAVPAEAFNQLTAAASQEGVIIKLTTGYRPYDYQKTLHDKYIRENGDNWTEQYSAEPGYSEHQTGLAADVSGESINFKLDPDFADTAEGRWLADNAHKFGFIIRYPEGKEDITGYAYEPWHIRYVGVNAATDMYNRNLTLEEYLGDI